MTTVHTADCLLLLQNSRLPLFHATRLPMSGNTPTRTVILKSNRASTSKQAFSQQNAMMCVPSYADAASEGRTVHRLVLQQSWVPGMNGAPVAVTNHHAWCSELDVSNNTCAEHQHRSWLVSSAACWTIAGRALAHQ